MALSQRDALDTARMILNDYRAPELIRLNRIALAMSPDFIGVEVPPGMPATMRELAHKSRTNYLPLIVDNLAQPLEVVGYRPANQTENARPWATWQTNGLDARQNGVHRAALTYGTGYVVVSRGDRAPVMRGVSPRQLTALYGEDDDWPILALERDGRNLRLYDEEQVYYLGTDEIGMRLDFIEPRAHDLGVCPVIRFRDRMLLRGEAQLGVVEPLLSIQSRVDETVFGLLVTQYFQAFAQRYVIGWAPEDAAQALKARASELWTFEDPDVKVGQFAQANLDPLLSSKESGVRDMAALAQLPPQNFAVGAVSNLSAEALAALEANKDRKVGEIETSLGESWEQALRLAGVAEDDEAAAADTSSQVRWRDATARSLAQTVDALGKMGQMLGIPRELLWERIPGFTEQDVERAKALSAQGDSLARLTDLLNSPT